MITGDGDEPQGCKPTDKYTKEANNPLTITVRKWLMEVPTLTEYFLIVKDGYYPFIFK